MATYYARKAGNINAADVWATTPSGTAGAVTFVAGDVLMANSFAITVNVSTNLGSTGEMRNDAANGATAGGTFTLANGVTLTANIFAGTATCVTFSGASPNTASIIGNCTAGGANGIAASNTGNGTLSIVGNCTGGSAASSSSFGVNNTGVGTINITGNCTGGSATSTFGVNNNAAGKINITGNCTAGSAATAHGAINASTGTLTIVGPVSQGGNANLTGGTITGAFGATNASTGSMFITGPIYASEFDGGVSSANRGGLNFLTGPFYTSPVWGVNPIRCVSWRWATNLVNTTFIEVPTANLAAKRNLVTPDNATNFPAASNVRSGTTYGISGELVGTCAVPSPVSVASGIAVDNTVGTLTTPTAEQIKDAVWSATNRTITGGTVDTLTNAPSSVTASDIWSYATRTTTGGTVDTLTNAPSVPSASAIASQVRTELGTELGRIDQNISSRLAASAYTAPTTPPTAAEIATAVEGSLLNEADGQAVLNAIVGAIGNTNLSEVSLVAAVRADLERAGGKLDNIPTTSAPSASTVAGAVWSAAARTVTGGTVDNLTNAPASVTPSDIWSHTTRTLTSGGAPSVVQIRQEMDANSTKLANLDAPVSGATAPSAATVASAVRAELTEISRLDVAVSSRMAGSEATKLDAVKAKTDALNTERLANVPTVNILGTLLAQANS